MPFKPGKSGNPGGRSGEKLWREALRKAAHDIDPASKKRCLEVAAEQLVKAAVEGDVNALKELGDRLDGKSTQQIDANFNFLDTLNVDEYRAIVAALSSDEDKSADRSATTH